MPFFPDDQVKLILDGLKNQRTAEEFALFVQAFRNFDAYAAQDSAIQTLCNDIQYVSDTDLDGMGLDGQGGLITFLTNLQGNPFSPEVILNAITQDFLPRYKQKVTRSSILLHNYRFPNLKEIIDSYFVSSF